MKDAGKLTYHEIELCIFLSGSGAYCDNNLGAVSTTGHGESIMKVTLCRLVLQHIEQGMCL